MVHIENEGPPANVPLVYYDRNGTRHVVGEATVALRQGQLRIVGALNDIPNELDFGDIGMGHYSIGLSEDASDGQNADIPKGGPPPGPPSDAQVGSAFRRYMEGKLNGPN